MDEDETFPKPKGDSITESKNPSDKKSERPTAKAKKYAMQIFNATLPEVSQYVKWSEKSITWTREDHLDLVPRALCLGSQPRIDTTSPSASWMAELA
jgi:hypothetical protein